MPPSTPQRWKRSCWPGIGSSAVNWTASGHTWATRVKKGIRRLPKAANSGAPHYGHPPACGSGNRQTASQQVFETLKKRGHPDAPPPLVSDGWGGVDEAIIAVYGAVPAYTGIGRPPTRKRPQPGWQYLQVVKQRQESSERHCAWSRSWRCWARAIERTHLTMRLFNGRLTRKTLASSKLVAMYCRLGGPGLQPGPTAQDAASGEQHSVGYHAHLRW